MARQRDHAAEYARRMAKAPAGPEYTEARERHRGHRGGAQLKALAASGRIQTGQRIADRGGRRGVMVKVRGESKSRVYYYDPSKGRTLGATMRRAGVDDIDMTGPGSP